MTIVQTLQKSNFFKGIDPKIVHELSTHCHLKKYSKGNIFFEAGDTAESFFIIISGWVKLFRVSRDGEESVIHIFGHGESFAEAAVFREAKKYPVNAQAVSEVELIEIPRSFFIQQIKKEPQFALCILASISSRQHDLIRQLEQVTTRTAPQRIGAFLLRFCQQKKSDNGEIIVDLPYDKSLICNRLNIKPETFSRALDKLAPYGVNSDKNCIAIYDIDKLANFCDVTINKPLC